MVGGGGLDGLLPGFDHRIEVCLRPGAFESFSQRGYEVRQVSVAVGAVGGGGLHGLLSSLDRRIQVC